MLLGIVLKHVHVQINIYIYYGDAASFHKWQIRTRLRIAGKTGGQYIEAMSKVCDGLRGDVNTYAHVGARRGGKRAASVHTQD